MIDRTAVEFVGAVFAVVWFVTLVYVWMLYGKIRRLEQVVAETERLLQAAKK